MRKRRRGNVVWHNVGKLLMIVACSMLFPLLTACYYQESCIWVFLLMLPVTMSIGFLLMLLFRPVQKEVHLQVRDGAAIVTYGWIAATLLGMLPYLLAGTFDHVVDAFFEALPQ